MTGTYPFGPGSPQKCIMLNNLSPKKITPLIKDGQNQVLFKTVSLAPEELLLSFHVKRGNASLKSVRLEEGTEKEVILCVLAVSISHPVHVL